MGAGDSSIIVHWRYHRQALRGVCVEGVGELIIHPGHEVGIIMDWTLYIMV